MIIKINFLKKKYPGSDLEKYTKKMIKDADKWGLDLEDLENTRNRIPENEIVNFNKLLVNHDRALFHFNRAIDTEADTYARKKYGDKLVDRMELKPAIKGALATTLLLGGITAAALGAVHLASKAGKKAGRFLKNLGRYRNHS